jgi:hypothetical protein
LPSSFLTISGANKKRLPGDLLAGQKQRQEWKQNFVQLTAQLRFETCRAQVVEKGEQQKCCNLV